MPAHGFTQWAALGFRYFLSAVRHVTPLLLRHTHNGGAILYLKRKDVTETIALDK